MRALITGGTGFVGSNLVRRLLVDGHEVHLLLRPGARRWRLQGLEPDLQLHTADLRDGEAVASVLARARVECVFHLGVHGAYSFETDPSEMVLTNVLGTANLLRAALKAGCGVIVNAGSSSEYGKKDHPAREEEALEPNSYYAVTKAAATWLCRQAAREEGLLAPTLRLYSVYGPYEDPRRLMPTLVAHALEGKWSPLAQPDIAHDYVYVDDVVEAYLLAATTPGQDPGAVYNVASGRQTSLAQLVEVARHCFCVTAEPSWGSYPARPWDTAVWTGATERIQAALGWAPRHSLEQGLRAMAAWMEEQPEVRRAALEEENG